MANIRLTTGSDIRNGSLGADTFDGYAGDDGFGATGGADTLNGRAGDDLFLLNSEYSDVSGLIDGGADSDTVRAYGFDLGDLAFQNVETLSVESFEFGASIAQFNSFETITSSNALMTRIKFYLNGEGGVIDASAHIEEGRSVEFDAQGLSSGYDAIGTDLADVLKNSHFDDTVHGGLGNDSIWSVNQNASPGGTDQLFGDQGNDAFYIRNQSGTVDGGAGTDTVFAYQFVGGFGGNQFGDLGDMAFVNVEKLSTGPLLTTASLAQLNSFATITGGDAQRLIRINLSEDLGGAIDFSDKLKRPGEHLAFSARLATSEVDVTGSVGDDVLVGSAFADRLAGGLGNDYLGGAEFAGGPQGRDTLIGGEGDDTYFVDPSDRLIELVGPAGGIDTVIATASYDLDAVTARLQGEFENLTLGGYLGAEDPNSRGYGNNLNNVITGNDGHNWLDGRGGADTLVGHNGNDTYIVDDEGDVVRESLIKNQGHDRVLSSVSFELQGAFGPGDAEGFVEDLILTGSGDIDGFGNELNNRLTGNSGDNELDGRLGIDTMRGLEGDDVYQVDSTQDRVLELPGGGIDTVFSSVSFDLREEFVENLTLTGDQGARAKGNSLNNVITGNDGANLIRGLGGADTLTGGDDRDVFRFETTLTAQNVDRVLDFATGEDKLSLDDAIFTALDLGKLDAEAFAYTLDGTADEADDRIIYNANTGELFYDANGSAGPSSGAKLFAILGLFNNMTEDDFRVV